MALWLTCSCKSFAFYMYIWSDGFDNVNKKKKSSKSLWTVNWTIDLLIIVFLTPFSSAVYLHIAGAKYCPPFSPSWLWLRLKYFTLLLCYKQENRQKIKLLPDSQHTLTMKLPKPWTPEILLECYCVAREEPIRHGKTKEQAATNN